MSDPGALGNASSWAADAAAKGILVNQTPMAGSIAQWNAGAGGLGHVAYVQSVDTGGTGITITEDNYVPSTARYFPGGYTAEVHITAGSAVWPANFIHFAGSGGSGGGTKAVSLLTTDGHVQVFSDANGTLAENWYDPGSGHIGGGSSAAGMTVQGTPALVARPGQTVIDAFVRNSAGQIVETWYNWGTGLWGGWITVNGGSFTSDPSAVVTSDGHDQVFATSNGGTLAMNWFDPGSGHIGGGSSAAGMTVQGTPALVARPGQTVIDAFVRNSAGQIVETWYNWGTGLWGGWIPIAGGTFTSDPTAVPTPDGHDQVFANAGGTPEQNWFDPGTGNVGSWIIV